MESVGEFAHPVESGFLWRRSEGNQDSSPPGNARKSRSFYLHRYVPPIPRQRQVSRQPRNGSLVNQPLFWIVVSCAPFNLSSVVYAPFRRPLLTVFSSRKAIIVFFLLLLLLLKEAVSFSKDTSRRKKLNGNKIENKIDIGGREFESNYNLTR